MQGSINNHSCHTGTAGGHDWLGRVDSLALKQLLQLILGQEGLRLGVEHLVERNVDGARHMTTGQARPGLRVVAGPAAIAPRIDDLYALGTLLVVIQGNLPHVLVAGDLVGVDLRDGIGVALDGIHLPALGRVSLVNPQAEVVEDVDIVMAKDLEGPAHAWGAEDAQLLCIVDNNSVLAPDAQFAHGGGERFGSGQHVGVVAVLIDDLVEIEEAGLGNALLAEDLNAGAAFGVVWHEPGRA